MTRYPDRKCLAVDVDGTLLAGGRINPHVVAFARARMADGYDVYVWSARGKEHARQAAEMAGLDVPAFAKPSLILDDAGWSWVRYTRVASRDDVVGGE